MFFGALAIVGIGQLVGARVRLGSRRKEAL